MQELLDERRARADARGTSGESPVQRAASGSSALARSPSTASRGRSALGRPGWAEGTPVFTTTSLELASYLVLTGHPIVRITGPRARRRIVFEAVSEADRLSFYNGATVSARQLFEVWHSLRHGLMNLLD